MAIQYTCGGNIDSGETCEVHCETGYDAYDSDGEYASTGVGTATCMTGQFINLPTCIPRDCFGSPPEVIDADESWTCGELAMNPATGVEEYKVKNGDSCEIQCREGYTSNIRHTTNSTRCILGEWEYTGNTTVPTYKHGAWGYEDGLKCEKIVFDCAGVYNGDAYNDTCGVCDADPTNDCEIDCNGVWAGDSYLDACYICDDNVYNDCPYQYTFEFIAGEFDIASSDFDYPSLRDAVESSLCGYFENVLSNLMCSVTSMLMLEDNRRRLSDDLMPNSTLFDNSTNTTDDHVAVMKYAHIIAEMSVKNAIDAAHNDQLNETTAIGVSDEANALVTSLQASQLEITLVDKLMEDSSHVAMANEVKITNFVMEDNIQHAPAAVDDDNDDGGDSNGKWDWITETHTLIGVGVGAAFVLVLALVLRYACRSSVKPSREMDLTSNNGTLSINKLCDDDDVSVHRSIELPKTPSHSLDICFDDDEGNSGDGIDSTTGV